MRSWAPIPDSSRMDRPLAHSVMDFVRPVVGDVEGARHVLLQPLDQVAQEAGGLGLVSRLGVTRGGAGQVERGGVVPQGLTKVVVGACKLEEDLVRLLLVLVMGRVVRLDEVEIEVPGRNGG
jgi:hypothetical protein